MTDYRRTKKSGKQHGSKIADYKRRPYTPRPSSLSGGGSYGGPKNYYRHHDFKYEKEPELKPPKVETHYAIERPIESYRPPPYRPELDQTSVEKIIGQTIDRYHRNETEGEGLETDNETKHQTDTPAEIPEIKSAGEISQQTSEITPELDLGISAQPESLSEVGTGLDATIDNTPDPFESIELPIADLELLLIELDANPLEAQPEKIVEAEGAVEQQ